MSLLSPHPHAYVWGYRGVDPGAVWSVAEDPSGRRNRRPHSGFRKFPASVRMLTRLRKNYLAGETGSLWPLRVQ